MVMFHSFSYVYQRLPPISMASKMLRRISSGSVVTCWCFNQKLIFYQPINKTHLYVVNTGSIGWILTSSQLKKKKHHKVPFSQIVNPNLPILHIFTSQASQVPGKNTSYRVHCWKQLLSLTRLPAVIYQAHLRDGVASIIIILLNIKRYR
jgi:hypothetical protein